MTTLNKNLPLDSDYVGNGAGELRDIKAYILDMVEPMIPPVGSITPYLPGYFTSGANANFTEVSLTLEDNYKICDGSVLNDSDSPIFNGGGRYLPNLTEDRFLMGDSSYGVVGGYSTITLSTSNLPTHNHTYSGTTGNENANHTHGISFNTGTTNISHTHLMMQHTHDYWFCFSQEESLVLPAEFSSRLTGGVTYTQTNGDSGSGYNGYARKANTGSMDDQHYTSTSDPAHAHLVSGNTGTESVAHAHTYSGTSSSVGSGTAFENRPKYLSCKYIMRIK